MPQAARSITSESRTDAQLRSSDPGNGGSHVKRALLVEETNPQQTDEPRGALDRLLGHPEHTGQHRKRAGVIPFPPGPSDEVRQSLIREHQRLVRQQYATGLSTSEGRRLDLIRWQLDQMDTTSLDQLESHIREQESLAKQIEGFRGEVANFLRQDKTRRR